MKRLLTALAIALSIAAPAAARDTSPTFPDNMQGEWCFTSSNAQDGAVYLGPGVLGRDCDNTMKDIFVTPTVVRNPGGAFTCEVIKGRVTESGDDVRFRATLSCGAPDTYRHWIEHGTFVAPTRGMAGLMWKRK
jgi:hypothetical protein